MPSTKIFVIAGEQHQEDFLDEFHNVEPEVFVRAVEEGQVARQATTPNHPITAAGTHAYNDTVRALRDKLLPIGWTKKSISNQELVISPDKTTTIIVASGDEQTGIRIGREPTTKNPKGSRMSDVCAKNAHLQLPLFPNPVNSLLSPPRVYILLFFEDVEKGEVRAELVLPTDFDKGQISGITKRYILPPIPIDAKPEINTLPEAEYTPDINITIKSKTS